MGMVETINKAIKDNDFETVKKWLKSDGNPNQYDFEGWTPLLVACVRGKAKFVHLLLNNTIGLNANPNMPFMASGALPIHFAGHSLKTVSWRAVKPFTLGLSFIA